MSFQRRGRIWVPENFFIGHPERYLEGLVEMPKIRISGHLTIELIDAATGVVKRRLDFDNLLTNAGLDAIGNGVRFADIIGTVAGQVQWCGCGTGSTAPANTDTALVTEITPTTTNRTNLVGGGTESNSYNASPEYWERVFIREFSTSQANGNLTEIGFFTLNSGGTMPMRQLFKDGTGTPITITKTSSDILRVTYKVRMHPPASDSTSSITISGSNYTWTLRPLGTSTDTYWGSSNSAPNMGVLSNIGQEFITAVGHAVAFETNTLAARTALVLSTGGSACTSTSWSSYSNGNFFRDMTNIWSTTAGNFGTGLGGVELYQACNGAAKRIFQEVFSPKLTKDNTKQLTLVHRFSWARFP